jgi:AraC-like DNA-binding protein
MKKLLAGQYIGTTMRSVRINDLILSKSHYENDNKTGWHSHENPFFALVLKGGNLERRRRNEFQSKPGTLLFYREEEVHCNSHYYPGSVNFHIEFTMQWFKKFELDITTLGDIQNINNANGKFAISKLMMEFRETDPLSSFIVDGLLLQTFGELMKSAETVPSGHKPKWLLMIVEMLNDEKIEDISLRNLSRIVNIHPTTISKAFPKYFNDTLGDYLKKCKVKKSLALLTKKNKSIDEISFECGFYDASHFVKTFKRVMGFTPGHYRKTI